MSKALIVAVDDDATILKLVKAILQKQYQLKTFSDPKKALNSLSSGLQPDLILCDVSMPEMSGFDLHTAVRDIPLIRSVPFVYLTAIDDRENLRRGMRQGADDYLTKPFTADELREAVSTRIKRTSSLKGSEEKQLEISSMGGLGISSGGVRLTWEAKKAVELLLYMLAAKNAVPLKQLHGDLWWDLVSENNLHVLINRLRKTVNSLATLTVEHEALELELHLPYTWDAETFEQSAKKAIETSDSAQIESTIRAYNGEFLPGFDSPWTERQRGHYEEIYADLLERSIIAAQNDTARQLAQERFDQFMGLEEE